MSEIVLKPESMHDFELLFSIKKDTLNAIIEKIKNAEPGLSPEKISERFQEKLKIAPDDLERIARLIYGINQLKLSSGFDNEKIINDLLNALHKSIINSYGSENCKDYLSAILNMEGSVLLTILARDLAYSRERILLDTDIETDIRPIFDEDKFKGLVIIHTLKIEYEETGKGKNTIYIALDKDDLDTLERRIQRARLRESSLKTNISSTYVDFS